MRSTRARAVIGAGYGDEGKGLMTDILAADNPQSVVVRANGGAQAGHTVVTPDGRRHVFHHVGSGALAGVPTHLSRHFVAHPMMMLAEWEDLQALGAKLSVSSDPRALVTTPFDMMINQAVELARGKGRHGSCGLGFGETIERSLRPEFAILTRDLFMPDLTERLRHIGARWMPERLAQLGLDSLPEAIVRALDVERVIDRFVADCLVYLDRVQLWPDTRIREKGEVIFEAAQGLMLDQDFGSFPHVTRSNTGLANMLAIAAEAGIDRIKATYATRCYVTRHGAGPLAHETAELRDIAVVDPTNAPNDWQGSIRIAPLDLDILARAIGHDLALARIGAVQVIPGLAVTCLDQADRSFTVRQDGRACRLANETAARHIAESVGQPLLGEARGPSRDLFRPAPAWTRAA